jgi:hypothetical protein
MRFSRTIATSPVASWFETREDALLTMRVWDLGPRVLRPHRGLGPHPEEPAFAGVSKDGAMAACLLLAVPQPAVDRAEHIAIIVGPDPLLLVGLGQLPLLG